MTTQQQESQVLHMTARNPGPATWHTSWCLHAELHGHACLGACYRDLKLWNATSSKIKSLLPPVKCRIEFWNVLASALEHYFPKSPYKNFSLQRTPRMCLKLQWLQQPIQNKPPNHTNNSPGPDSTQTRNSKGTQAWNRWITNTTSPLRIFW